MNTIQSIILRSAYEESGIWDILLEIAQAMSVDEQHALNLLKAELPFILSRDDIYFIFSNKLYDTASSEVIDKNTLINLALNDAKFNESGPFYYLSCVPCI